MFLTGKDAADGGKMPGIFKRNSFFQIVESDLFDQGVILIPVKGSVPVWVFYLVGWQIAADIGQQFPPGAVYFN